MLWISRDQFDSSTKERWREKRGKPARGKPVVRFGFFKEQAPNVLGLKDDAVVDKLSKAIDTIQYTVQLKLDKQLDTWERYCIMHCFDIPKGLSFPEMNYPYNSPLESSREDESSDMDLDSRLESLRESLVAAGRKSAELRGELSILERQAAVNARRAEVLDDALQPLEENTTHDFTTEFIRATSVLREKLEHWKTERRDKMENLRIERIRSPNIYNIKRKYFPGFEANIRCRLITEGLVSKSYSPGITMCDHRTCNSFKITIDQTNEDAASALT
ncbi:hypothetical protein SUGI_0300010 [Cryptomeria japonica]|nr:hypothetical protein SUGI_0300010 [Cryptomeria japonica]